MVAVCFTGFSSSCYESN
uniref:Uncharacterized protein n=1 Tax=Rhizophora mucronata TaxID=61149 RepID=A0A2P2IJV2_RHIMU